MCPHGYHHNGFMATPALLVLIDIDALCKHSCYPLAP